MSLQRKIPNDLAQMPFSVEEAKKHGISRFQLYMLVKNGLLERLERGVYRVPEMDIAEEASFRTATLIVGSASAICLLSALCYYNLSDEIPRQTWIMVERNKRVSHKNIRLIRTTHPKWNIGIDEHSGYKITSIERTLIESIIGKRYLGTLLGIEALKLALAQNKTSLNKIIDTASKLGNIKKIQKILEVLS